MEHTVYFADKSVMFTLVAPDADCCVCSSGAGSGIDRAKILKILETHNCVAVVSPDPTAAFAAFADGFTAVEAAGGIVVNDSDEWLMIHRNGRWDLPKGHLEPGETLEVCAAREVCEETGVRGSVVRPLCDTFHAYCLRGHWELKRTQWYELHADGETTLAPQREEGIDRVEWCSPERVRIYLNQSFPTIRRVAACMLEPSVL